MYNNNELNYRRFVRMIKKIVATKIKRKKDLNKVKL